VTEIARTAKKASRALALAPTAVRDAALRAAAQALRADEAAILEANAKDLAAARAKGLTNAMTDRLRLDHARLEDIAVRLRGRRATSRPGRRSHRGLDPPERPAHRPPPRPDRPRRHHLRIAPERHRRRRRPLPEVRQRLRAPRRQRGHPHEQFALSKSFATGLRAAGLPAEAVTLLPFTDREAVPALGSLRGIVDIIVPRGGPGLIEAVVNSAKVHSSSTTPASATSTCTRRPTSRWPNRSCSTRSASAPAPATPWRPCSSTPRWPPGSCRRWPRRFAAKKTEIRACPRSLALMPGAKAATEQDFRTEHLGLILNVKVVADLAEAVAHVEDYGSHHSDAIITADESAARAFLAQIDSACILERQHPLHRRRRVRLRGRSGHLHGPSARPRTHGDPRIDHLEVRNRRPGPGSGLISVGFPFDRPPPGNLCYPSFWLPGW
jgi:glutamate-5-semialdehyde dehydrogenase